METSEKSTPPVNSPVIKAEDRPKQSSTIGKIGLALAKAQGQMENADKDGKGTYGKYATLAATWDVIRKPLADNELAVYQRILTINSKPTMCTMIIHSSGEFFDDCELELKFDASGRMNAMQAMGSAVTYARRYSLQAITGVAPQDDDDGNGSGDPKPPEPPKKTYPQNPQTYPQKNVPQRTPAPKPVPPPPPMKPSEPEYFDGVPEFKHEDEPDLDRALMSPREIMYTLIDEKNISNDEAKKIITMACGGVLKKSVDMNDHEIDAAIQYIKLTKK